MSGYELTLQASVELRLRGRASCSASRWLPPLVNRTDRLRAMGRGREAKAPVLMKVSPVPVVTPVVPVVMMPVPVMVPMTMVPVAMAMMAVMPAPMVAVTPPVIAHLDDTRGWLPGESNGRAEVGGRRGLRAPHEQAEA